MNIIFRKNIDFTKERDVDEFLRDLELAFAEAAEINSPNIASPTIAAGDITLSSSTSQHVKSSSANLIIGAGADMATTATTGYLMIPTCNGAPTGVPVDNGNGKLAIIYDRANNQIYCYNGAWKKTVALT